MYNLHLFMKHKNKAFTLVELIVVITILSILWTIAYISLANYSKSSRNSVRVTDIWIIKQSLWVFEVDTGKYPLPSSSTDVTYSWWLLWYQWTFWESTKNNLDNLSKTPLDPLFSNQYDFSVTNNKTKYQLWTVFEWSLFSDAQFVNQTHALTSDEVVSYISWNYELKDLQAINWSNCYLITVPSLFVSNLASSWALDPLWNYNFVYDNWPNLTQNYISKLETAPTWSTFQIQELYDECSIDTLNKFNLYISKLALAYQQLNWVAEFEETIYDFNTLWYKIGSLDNLWFNKLTVSSDVAYLVRDPNSWSIYTDTFTWVDSTELVWSHTGDSFWIWQKAGAILNSSYVLSSNQLSKTDIAAWTLTPVPVLPITSYERTISLEAVDFWGWNINIFSHYTDSNNFYWVELNAAWYTILHPVWWVQTWPYPLIVADPIALNSQIEFTISWDNIKLSINWIQKENNTDWSAIFNGSPALEIDSIWWKIDDFNLIYK